MPPGCRRPRRWQATFFRLPDRPFIVAAMARISAQTSFDGLMRFMLPKKMPADQEEKLIKDFRQVTQRISEVGLLFYKQNDASTSSKKATDDMRIAFLAKVDDAPAFVQEKIQLILQLHQAMQKYGGDKTELKTEQKRIAGKPSWLITVRTPIGEKNNSKEKKSFAEETFLLTEIDSRTVLGAIHFDVAQAEAFVNRFSEKPAQSLGFPSAERVAGSSLHQHGDSHESQERHSAGVIRGAATLPAGVEAQFVVPFGSLQAMFDSINEEKKEKKTK